jgi:tetratricopeptide (TPR) repeat protein
MLLRSRCVWLVTLAGLLLRPWAAHAADMNWGDIESRIQYAYFTEDVRSIRGVLELLVPGDSTDPSKSYYTGFANYRLLLLTETTDRAHAKEPAERCVSSLDRALEQRKDFAEALALQSACLDSLATLQPWRAPFAAAKSGTQLEKARHLAPANPRVLLLNAVGDYERTGATTTDKNRALEELKQAAAAFEAERQQAEHVPQWGGAETYVYLARCYLDRGDALGARDALERALLIAPEFAQARRLMARLTAG